MSITINKLLIFQVVSWLNERQSAIGLSSQIMIDKLAGQSASLWVRSISKPFIVKKYTDGSYIGNIQFELFNELKSSELDGENSKLDLPFWQISNYLDIERLETLDDNVSVLKFEMLETPEAFERRDDGTAVNKAIFTLEYKQN